MSTKNIINNLKLAKIKQNNWLLAEDIPNINFNFCQIWLTAFTNDLSKACGRNYETVVYVSQKFYIKYYFKKKDSAEFSKFVLNKIIKNPSFGEKINSEIIKGSDRLKKYSAKLKPELLSKLSNKELIKIYADLDKIHTDLYSWGWLPNAVDMFQNDFTVFLKKLLRKKLDENEINQALIALSTSHKKSIFQKDHESFLSLVALKQVQGSKLTAAINNHLKKYFYLKYLWLGNNGVYDFNYYANEIKKFIKSEKNATNLLKEEKKYLKEL